MSAPLGGTQFGRPGARRRYGAAGQELREPPAERPRVGAKRTVMDTIRQIPSYLKLLVGLMRDSRVSKLDKLLVGAAIAYVVSPFDLIPDFIPFLGQVDDVFLVLTALQRLITHAGRMVVLEHWDGDPRELADLNIARVLSAAAFFLPPTMRRSLKRLARRR